MPHPLLLDENLNVALAPALNARGFDVITARDVGLLRTPDTIVTEWDMTDYCAWLPSYTDRL